MTLRQAGGDKKGSRPSIIKANPRPAPRISHAVSPFQKITAKSDGQGYFLAGAAAAAALPLKALKNSLLAGSSTITSPFLLKLALLASKLR